MTEVALTRDAAASEPDRIGKRLLFAAIALLAGEVVILLLTAQQPLQKYFIIATALGWACIGLPLVLPASSRFVSRTAWPVILIAGACLGPLALAALSFATALLHAISGFGLSTFRFAGLFTATGGLWPIAGRRRSFGMDNQLIHLIFAPTSTHSKSIGHNP